MLLNVLPDSSKCDGTAQSRCHTLIFRDCFVGLLCRASDTDLPHIGLGEFGAVDSFAAKQRLRACTGAVPVTTRHPFGVESRAIAVSSSASAFRPHVGHVVVMSAEPKVAEAWTYNPVDFVEPLFIISNTRRDVAGMADLEPILDRRSTCILPGVMMSGDFLESSGNNAVAHVPAHIPLPAPTGAKVGSIDLWPEPFADGDCYKTAVILGVHQDSPPGVAPRDVCSVAGAFACPNYTVVAYA